MLGNRAPGAHLPGVQAEDHLGRLPPGQLPAGGYQRRAPRLRLPGSQPPSGLADLAGRHTAGACGMAAASRVCPHSGAS
jgi:hypothetical protein